MLANPISTSNWLNTHRQLLECWFLAWREKYTNFPYMPDNASNSHSKRRLKYVQLTTAVSKSAIRDTLKNNINHIIQHQNSQVINKIFAGKKENAKKLKSVQNVLDNPDPDPDWAKMISNPVPDPKKSHKSAGSDSKNLDPEQHWCAARQPTLMSTQPFCAAGHPAGNSCFWIGNPILQPARPSV